jgi:hypothetical protein
MKGESIWPGESAQMHPKKTSARELAKLALERALQGEACGDPNPLILLFIFPHYFSVHPFI